MENFLRSKEYWELIEPGYVQPTSGAVLTDAQQKKNDEMKLKDLKAKNYLFQAIERTVLETILKKDTSKDIWGPQRF
jgi:2-polyprenyl-6-methoxyphenol hydroxylase-like FAD-dependent oxidoreductase